jgi:hypothetical protein
MKRNVFVAVLMVLVALPAFAGTPIRSEARVYFSDYNQLVDRLGSLLGQLDMCTHGTAPDGREYMVVIASADELKAIRAAGLQTEVTWPDVRDKFRAMTGCNPDDGSFRDFGYYFNYWEMRDTISHLAASFPLTVRIDSSMRSFHNKPLYCLKISDNPETNENEPQIFINAASHAREPMGTHACIVYATLLCRNYGTDSLVTWLVNNREIYIVPVMNPDGYIYNSDSGGSNAYWRKNRNNTSPRTGPGVDLNRNYGFKWGFDDNGSSPYPSDETYRGPSRFSEPEVAAIRDLEAANKFRTCMDFHTYGQYNLYAWGHDNDDPPEYTTILRPMGETLMANNGYSQTGPTYRTIYCTNGNSVDWEQSDTLLNGSPKFVTYAFSTELGINDFWYGSNNPSYVDNEVAINIPNVYYLTRVSGVYLQPTGSVVNDTSSGNANGRLDPGETANLWFKLRNQAIHPLDTAKAVTAVLISPDTMVQVITPSANLPAIPRSSSADSRAGQFQVVCSPNATPNSNIDLRLEVTFTDDGVTIMQPLTYRITLGNQLGVGSRPPDYTRAELSLVPDCNPTHSSVRLTAVIPASRSGTCLCLFAKDGKLVRTLLAGRPQAGRYSLDWNRRDDAGHLLPAGVYYARLANGSTGVTAKLVVTD